VNSEVVDAGALEKAQRPAKKTGVRRRLIRMVLPRESITLLTGYRCYSYEVVFGRASDISEDRVSWED
jgi:hypothetical protein